MRSIDDFKDAERVLSKVLSKTKLIRSQRFSAESGNDVFIKPENLQLTGSFKIRGAFYKISKLTDEQKAKGLVASSAGNHAQGVALGAKMSNTSATIVMPTTAPLVKVNNTKNYGAEVVLHGDVYDEAYEHALDLANKHGYEFIHAFNDLDVATGQGTIAYEIFKDLPEVDILLVPVGGGGLIAGISTLAKMLRPNIKVIGVEPKGSASMSTSIKNGKITTLEKSETIADGVAVNTPGDIVFPYIQKNVDDFIIVDDNELVEIFLDIMEENKIIVECSGLLPLAALKHLDVKGKDVACVVSGGNMDVLTIPFLVEHGLIKRGRIFTFTVLVPHRPGELVKLTKVIAQEKANVIKIEHEQFVNVNRNSSRAVQVNITLETFGLSHKQDILKALAERGYEPTEEIPNSVY